MSNTEPPAFLAALVTEPIADCATLEKLNAII
jgi:hypothetical protein